MFTHLFKLILNKKKQNALLIIEMFISFIVMFVVFTLIVFSYNNYRQPLGFDYKDVWVVNFTPPENINSSDSVAVFHDALKNLLISMPQIKEASFSGNNVPFSTNTMNWHINYNNIDKFTNWYVEEESYQRLLNMHMLSGRWFLNTDQNAKAPPVVITENLKNELFGKEDAIGKMVGTDGDIKLKVVGVVQNLKDKGDYQAIENGAFRLMDTGWARSIGNIVLKVRPDTDAAFESKLFKTISNAIGTNIEIEHLDKKLVSKNKLVLVPMIIVFVVAGFLIINVALGLFGVLWYNINKRRGEIGLRRAVGATGNSISKQLVSEALVLSTISLIIGCFFAFQFPLLNVFDLPAGIYLAAIGLSIVFIYALVTICALYPGKQAAAIYPAVALHEE